MFRFSLKWKFAVLLIGFTIATGIIGLMNLKTSTDVKCRLGMVSGIFPLYTEATSLDGSFDKINRFLEDALVLGESILLERCEQERNLFLNHFKKLNEMGVEPKPLAFYELDRKFKSYYEKARDLIVFLIQCEIERGDIGQCSQEVEEDRIAVSTMKKQIEADLDLLVNEIRTDADVSLLSATEEMRLQSLKTFMIGLVSILLILVFLFYISRRIVLPVGSLSTMASKVAEGNLEPKTEMALVSNDEIGDLYVSFQTMTQGLKETTVSKSYLDNILESMADTLIVVNSDGKIRTANRAALNLLEWELDELIGYRFHEVVSKNTDEISRTSIVDELIQENSVVNANMFYKTKAGDIIPVSFSSSVMRDTNDDIQGIVCVATDITERKLAEQEKEKLQLQLQQAQKMEAIGTLAGGVAHDLNNILSGIVTYPDLLLMQTSEDSPLRNPLLTIQETGKKAAAIVQDMLTLARRGVAITEVVNLNDVIFEYLNSPEYKKMKLFYPDVEMETNLEPGLLNILGSPIHISKTIMNLVSNAAEAIGKHGRISITTENRYVDKPVRGYDNVKDGDYAMIIVSDTGEGISTQDMEKIFEPFYTKKRMGKSGTGLGMPVVWGTVKDHNGYIDLQSTEGKGTTFTLYFPITRKEPAKHEIHLQIEDYMGSGESILVVDDVKEQREIALTILSELGYSVNTVPSGEEAVKYMQKTSIDLLILDMIMDPGMDGLDTYKEILKLHPGQRAIIASGFSETDRAKEVVRLGAGQYIKKPYTLEKMGMAVRKELNRA